MSQTKELPSYSDYKAMVELNVQKGKLDLEQGVMLVTIYRNHLNNKATNVRSLMEVANLNWKMTNAKLNGLVMRNACKKIDKYWYSL